MKTRSNSMLMDKLHKQITDEQLKLKEKLGVYVTALKADEPFEKVKDLYNEIKNIRKALKQLEAQIIISNYLAEYSN
jgi:hypothetical protein